MRPLLLTAFLWTAAQFGEGVTQNAVYQPADLLYPVISGTLLLALIGAAIKYGKLLNRMETLSAEVDRLRKRLDK